MREEDGENRSSLKGARRLGINRKAGAAERAVGVEDASSPGFWRTSACSRWLLIRKVDINVLASMVTSSEGQGQAIMQVDERRATESGG